MNLTPLFLVLVSIHQLVAHPQLTTRQSELCGQAEMSCIGTQSQCCGVNGYVSCSGGSWAYIACSPGLIGCINTGHCDPDGGDGGVVCCYDSD
jgi:hypothetical protein